MSDPPPEPAVAVETFGAVIQVVAPTRATRIVRAAGAATAERPFAEVVRTLRCWDLFRKTQLGARSISALARAAADRGLALGCGCASVNVLGRTPCLASVRLEGREEEVWLDHGELVAAVQLYLRCKGYDPGATVDFELRGPVLAARADATPRDERVVATGRRKALREAVEQALAQVGAVPQSMEEALTLMRTHMLHAALAACGGNRTAAARLLKMEPRSIFRLIAEVGEGERGATRQPVKKPT